MLAAAEAALAARWRFGLGEDQLSNGWVGIFTNARTRPAGKTGVESSTAAGATEMTRQTLRAGTLTGSVA